MKHITIALALTLLAGTGQAAVVNWSADLSPENEVSTTPVVSNGFGTGTGTIDTVSGLLTWTISWADMTGVAVAAHFHGPATPSQNADVVVNVGAISGLNPPSSGSTTINDVQTADLLAGLFYINVHTAEYPTGEIRGQVMPEMSAVPLPATLPLLAGAAALLGFAARRRT